MAESKTAAAPEKTAAKYSIEKLRTRSIKLFGVTTSTFDAATYGLKDNTYSVEEMRTIINRWCKKEVK